LNAAIGDIIYPTLDRDQSKLKKIIALLILFLVSIGMAIFVPSEVSKPYIYVCFVLFLLSTFLYYSCKKKDNFLDFDTIFILIYAILGFAYPVFFYDENNPYSIAFSLTFDVKYIPYGVVCFVIGIQAYYLGSLMVKEPATDKPKKDTAPLMPINNTILSIIVILLCLIFILAGGVQYFRLVYYLKEQDPESGLIFQIQSLLHTFAVAAIATEFYNKSIDRTYKINSMVILSIGCIVLLMLYVGNRTLASQLVLPILGLYSMNFYHIGKIKILLFVVVAIIGMWLIQNNRTGTAIESGPKIEEMISDLTIPTRSIYSCMEYVEENGYTYGASMSGGLMGAVPSLERLLIRFFGFDPFSISSAEVLTVYTLGPNPYVGLGTSIITDIFLSFGIIGVIVLMFFLGFFVNQQMQNAKANKYYSIIIYTCLMSFCVYLVRSTYTHPFKLIVWCLIIALLNKSLSQKWFNRTACKE
jgi:oligosaccharide repeat unit polymerase